MKENLKARYQKGWVTPDQLRRYAALGLITEADVADILGEDHHPATD